MSPSSLPTSWRNRLGALILLALPIAIGACASSHSPIEVRTDDGASDLAGVWTGTYYSRDTGRAGDIYFALSADADSAVGEVLMQPLGTSVSVERQPDGTWRWMGPGPTTTEAIPIQFVRIATGEVVGELATYRDPDCGCRLHTTFRGHVDGDRVTGTFQSDGEAPSHRAEGTWAAERRPDPAQQR